MKTAALFWRAVCWLGIGLALMSCKATIESELHPQPIASATIKQPTPSPMATATKTPFPPAATPTVRYQLTFTSDRHAGYYGVYAVEVGCLETGKPCFGEPELLFEVRWDGKGLPPIFSFDWAPDGSRIVMYDSRITRRGDIVVADWNGQNKVNISNSPGPDGHPDWSPDGMHILYDTVSIGKRAYLVSAKPDGTDAVELLTQSEIPTDPSQASFSPDGTQVVFTNYHVDGLFEGLEQVYIANLDGSDLRRLTSVRANHFYPSFSSDGEWIAFEREMDPINLDTSLFLIRRDGSRELPLTASLAGKQGIPKWAPFGNWIAFIHFGGDNDRLLVTKADGSQLVEVTQGSIDYIAWRKLVEP